MAGPPARPPRPPPPPRAGNAPPGMFCTHPLCQVSNGSACIDHSTLPVSMFIAITALAVFGVPEKALPVVTYSARRLTSSVGVAQMPAPAGSSMSLPREFLPTTFGTSGIVYVFQIWRPVAASSADMIAAERAAGVVGLSRLRLFERRDRHVQTSFEQHRRAGDARERMRIGERFPDLLAGAGGERVRGAVDVAEEDGEPRIRLAEPADGEPAPDRRLRAEAPVQAPGFRVERVDVAGVRRHIQPPVVDGLAVQRRRARKPERPLQLQARHLSGRQPGGRARLEPRVPVVDAPAVPGRRVRLADLRMTRTRVRHLLGRADQIGVELPAGHPFGDEPLVLIAQPRRPRCASSRSS